MKTLVTYFSHTGQTSRVAKEIAKRCSGDLDAIQEARRDNTWWAACRSGWDTVVRAAPPIQKPKRNPGAYDLVIIGVPVWRLGLAPPVRSYVQQYAPRFKRVAFFCAEGGTADERGFAELSKICGMPPVATLAVTRKHLPASANMKELSDFVDSMLLD